MAVISEPYKRLNILIMVVKILGNSDTTAYKEAERVVKSLGLQFGMKPIFLWMSLSLRY